MPVLAKRAVDTSSKSPKNRIKAEKPLLELVSEKKTREITLGKKTFIVPMRGRSIFWSRMGRKEREMFALANCTEKKESLCNAPCGLRRLLTPKQKERIRKKLESIMTKTVELNGQKFVLPVDGKGRVLWKKVDAQKRFDYVVAYCKEHVCWPGSVPSVIRRWITADEKKRVYEALKEDTTIIEPLDGKQIKVPLWNDNGAIAWRRMSWEEKKEYSLAYCRDKNCDIAKLPDALWKGLTKKQKDILRQELGIKERVEFWDGKEFRLPLCRNGRKTAWKKLKRKTMIDYVVAYCREKKCGVSDVHISLGAILKKKERKEIEKRLEKSRKGIFVVNKKTFELPLMGCWKRINWGKTNAETRVEYAIAYCKEKKRPISDLPISLYRRFKQDEKRKINEAIERGGIRTVKLNKKTFTIPLNNKGQIAYAKMSDSLLVNYSIAYCRHYRIKSSTELQKSKKGNATLHWILYDRGLMKKVFPPIKIRIDKLDGQEFYIHLTGGRIIWKRMSRKRIAKYAKAYRNEYGIKTSTELLKGKYKFTGLHSVLLDKELMDEVFERKRERIDILNKKKFIVPLTEDGHISWKGMTHEERIEYIKAYCAEHEITKVSELGKGKKKNYAIHAFISRKELSGEIFGNIISKTENWDRKEFTLYIRRDGTIMWEKFTKDQLIEYTTAYCKANKLYYLQQLKDEYSELVNALRRKRIRPAGIFSKRVRNVEIDGTIFEIPLKGKQPLWAKMEPEQRDLYAAMLYMNMKKKKMKKLPSGLYNRIDKERVARNIRVLSMAA